MIKILSIILTTILLTSTARLQAQKYTEGVYQFGLIALEKIPGSTADSIGLIKMKEDYEGAIAMTIYFKKDWITVIKKDFLGSDIRMIYDLKHHKAYEFKNISDQPGFAVNVMPENVSYSASENELLSKIKSMKGEVLTEDIFGLSGTKYNIEQDGSNFSFILTKDILVQDIQSYNPLPVEIGTVIQFTMVDQGVKFTLGMKSFSPIITDRNIFTIDTVGLMNFTKMRDSLQDALSDMKDEEELKKEKFGAYIPSALNTELIRQLAEEGALNKEDWTVSNALENHYGIDIPSILLLVIDYKNGFAGMDRSSLKALFKKYNILSPVLDHLLSDKDSRWNKIPEELKYGAVCIASIKDLLDNHSTKEHIVNNLISMDLLDTKETAAVASYLSGKLPLKDLLNEVNVFTRLEEGIAITDDDIYKQVVSFFDLVSLKMDTYLDINRDQDRVMINTDETNYHIAFSDLKERDYRNTDEDDEDAPIVYFDTTLINEPFYRKLLDVVKQIGADNHTGMAYNIYRLHPPFVRDIPEYNYNDITNAYPWILINEEAIYFQQFPKDDYTLMEGDVGCTFPYHPDGKDIEVSIGNFRLGDMDAGIDYVTTHQKTAFIEYLKEYHHDFGITEETLREKIDRISHNLFKDADELLLYLPGISLTIDKIFDITPRSEYHPRFTSQRNEFKDAYPSLHYVFRDDFIATGFRYDSTEHKVRFEFNGLSYTVDPGDRNMIRFIQANVKKSKSGKQLYPLAGFSVTTEKYYYLTPEQKIRLGKIVSLDF